MVAAKRGHPGAEGAPSTWAIRWTASGVRLRGRGSASARACVPSTTRLEGSFTVYEDSQRFYCFGCGLGGDVLDFIRAGRRT